MAYWSEAECVYLPHAHSRHDRGEDLSSSGDVSSVGLIELYSLSSDLQANAEQSRAAGPEAAPSVPLRGPLRPLHARLGLTFSFPVSKNIESVVYGCRQPGVSRGD